MNIYNVYILPTLLFVAQLEEVPKRYEEWERTAFKWLSKGPKEWGDPRVFKALKTNFKMPNEAKDLREVGLVAKARVCLMENAKAGGLRMEERRRALKRSLEESTAGNMSALHGSKWKDWYEGAHSVVVLNAVEEL